MDLYSESSCDIYLRDNNRSITPRTRILLLPAVVQGMRLLRDSAIAHLDLKFQNLLIGRGLIPRLTDFGESYNQKSNDNLNNGYTVPYVPHEQFSSPNERVKKNSRDTYSFGVMLDLIFMFQHIFPTRRESI
jgi:serine/threonine protein kinase